jgi:TolB-like protein
MAGQGVVLVFGDHRLDIDRRELRRGAELVDVEPKVFDLLVFLVQGRDRVVTKDDMLQAVWGGRIVSESALTTRLNAARRAVGDDGTAQRLIRTFNRKGVRFMGEVTELPDPASAPPILAPNADGNPSIAVLPFRNMSGDPEQAYFVDGMVQEIITALSRIRWLLVIALDSASTPKGQGADVKRVGHDLGVRYVLEGSVRKSGSQVRITGQLIDAATGRHLWADHFDGSLGDVFDLQDKVASSVAGVIEPTLQAAETARSANRPTSDLTAYDLYLRAYAMFLSSARQIPGALRLMEQAIARDADYGPALAWAAICCFRLVLDGRSEDPSADRVKGIAYARRALTSAGEDPGVLVNAALALAYFDEDIDAMIALADRALALNPNFARGWHIGGLLRVWAGQPDGALKHLDTALRLSPRTRIGTSANLIGLAHLFARRFDQAVPRLILAIQDDPGFPAPYHFLAVCYVHLGRLDAARDIVVRLRGVTNLMMPDVAHFRNAEHRDLLLSGFRLAVEGTASGPAR